MAASPLASRGTIRGRKCYVTRAFSRIPKTGDKITSGCLTPAFSGGHKWTEVLCNPCVLGGSPQKGTKSGVAASPLPSRGPTSERKCYTTPAFSGAP